MLNDNYIGFQIKTVSNLIKRIIANSTAISEIDQVTKTHGWVIGYLCDHLVILLNATAGRG